MNNQCFQGFAQVVFVGIIAGVVWYGGAPIIIAAADGLNRYAYVRNNPVRYNDPSGLCTGGEMVIIFNSCSGKAADYKPGDLTPVPLGCNSVCAAEMQQNQAIGDGMRAGAAYAELQAAMEYAAYESAMYALAWTQSQSIANGNAIAYANTPPPTNGGGGGGLRGALGSGVSIAVRSSRVAIPSLAIPAGAIPIGLAVAGGLLAPCDSQGCTNGGLGPTIYRANDSNGNPLPEGARNRRGLSGYVTKQGTIYVPLRVGERGHHKEHGHEHTANGKKYRNVQVTPEGIIVPVPGEHGEWQPPH